MPSVNPLVSYADQVTGASQEDPAAPSKAPVGVALDDPFQYQPMSPALYNEWNPPVTVDTNPGDINHDAQTDEITRTPVMGVPLNLPGMPGYVAPPPSLQTPGWLGSVADTIDGLGDMGERLTDMLRPDGAKIPMDKNTLGVPSVGQATPETFVAPDAKAAKSKGVYVTDDPAAQNKIVGLARSFVGAGTAYAFGGKSIGGASREGMVQAAYGYAGVKDLTSLAGSLATRGDEVPVNKLKQGDLITWEGEGHLFGHDRVGIYVGNGQIISATQKAGFHVMNVNGLPGAIGIRVRNDSGTPVGFGGGDKGVSLAASDSASYAAIAAAKATADAVNNIFGGNKAKKKKDDEKKSGGKKGGSPSGKGSKYYGSDQNNTNNSSHHYTGIGATK